MVITEPSMIVRRTSKTRSSPIGGYVNVQPLDNLCVPRPGIVSAFLNMVTDDRLDFADKLQYTVYIHLNRDVMLKPLEIRNIMLQKTPQKSSASR